MEENIKINETDSKDSIDTKLSDVQIDSESEFEKAEIDVSSNLDSQNDNCDSKTIEAEIPPSNNEDKSMSSEISVDVDDEANNITPQVIVDQADTTIDSEIMSEDKDTTMNSDISDEHGENKNVGPDTKIDKPITVRSEESSSNIEKIGEHTDGKPITIGSEESSSNNKKVDQISDGKNQQLSTDFPESSIYHLKWFEWKGEQTPIVTQNENGPCPLLAIANVLILARHIDLPKMQQVISAKQLMEYIGDCILSEAPKQEGNEEIILNYEQNMQDAIDIIYKLQTGIDVNVKFSGVRDFEFTPECIVFDLLKIVLYHGWLVDPQNEVTVNAIGGCSYNQLVEKILVSREGDSEKVVEGLVLEEFINSTASQLTYHGLCELNTAIKEGELCVFFRNNHFSTLYKLKGELFLLVTDQGFLTEPAVIWETLVNIKGDGQFVNSDFKSVTILSVETSSSSAQPSQSSVPSLEHNASSMSQEDHDYLIALSLQQDDQLPLLPQKKPKMTAQQSVDNDHKLALRLQEDENKLAREQEQMRQQQTYLRQQPAVVQPQPVAPTHRQQPQQSSQQHTHSQQDKDKCIIL